MNIINKMSIFTVSTVLVMFLIAYTISHIFGIVDRAVASTIGAILIVIYLTCFNIINEKTRWMKFRQN